jgi:methionine-rich copper-binding protein CopC
MMLQIGVRRSVALVVAASLLVLLWPGLAEAHSELVSSDPAQGAVEPSPFSGPIVLTFSDHLATGSKADLVSAAGTTVGKATVDGTAKTMSFDLAGPPAAGAYQVRWTSIADDGDLLRGIVTFSVAAAPSISPAASAEPTASPIPSAAPTTTADSPGPSVGPTPIPSADGDTSGSGGDVILPIVVALIVLGAGAAYLLTRRNRPTASS